MAATSKGVYGVIREALADYSIADILTDVGTAIASYEQEACDSDGPAELGAFVQECAHAMPAAHEIMGTLISAQAEN